MDKLLKYLSAPGLCQVFPLGTHPIVAGLRLWGLANHSIPRAKKKTGRTAKRAVHRQYVATVHDSAIAISNVLEVPPSLEPPIEPPIRQLLSMASIVRFSSVNTRGRSQTIFSASPLEPRPPPH